MKVFLAVDNDKIDEITECGLKLSDCSNRVLHFDDRTLPAVACSLNPRDIQLGDACSIISVLPDLNCSYIAEGIYFEEFENGTDRWNEAYRKSLVKPDNYITGSYRKPEFLITKTILPEQIGIFDSFMSEPILYENSETLYIGNAYADVESANDNLREFGVEGYCERLCRAGQMKCIEGTKYRIFRDLSDNTVFISARR